jgi:plasmid stabilization system protein ParE
MPGMVVKWNKTATRQLLDALDFIEEAGYAHYSIELEKEVIHRIRKLSQTPELYAIDRFRKNNKGNYRAFVVDNYRISYRIGKNEINIVRIRHTSRRIKPY